MCREHMLVHHLWDMLMLKLIWRNCKKIKDKTDNQSSYWKLLLEGNPKNKNPSAPELLCLGI